MIYPSANSDDMEIPHHEKLKKNTYALISPVSVAHESQYQSMGNNSVLGATNLDNFDIDDPLFQLCWRQQECSDCLRSSSSCSWCPFVCVSNILNGSLLPFFLWHGTYDRIKRLKYLQATLVLRFRVGFSMYIT